MAPCNPCVLVGLQDKAGQAKEATEQTVEQVGINSTWCRCSMCIHAVQCARLWARLGKVAGAI